MDVAIGLMITGQKKKKEKEKTRLVVFSVSFTGPPSIAAIGDTESALFTRRALYSEQANLSQQKYAQPSLCLSMWRTLWRAPPRAPHAGHCRQPTKLNVCVRQLRIFADQERPHFTCSRISMWLRRSIPTLARHARANQRSCLQSAFAATRDFSSAHSAITSDLIRNVAIVAHVDHGKTTLVDQLLKHGGNMLSEDRVMDSIDLERERGITIMSKCTRVEYNGHVLNIVDTPGHSDFGGEVERILSMVDGVVLVVDATEGPMSQTKFVLTKALNRGLKPLVVINKVDRETSRLNGDVENELFDMFVALEADDDQLEFPVLYASAKQGWAVRDLDDADEKRDSMTALLDEIIKYVPSPVADATAPFSMAVTMIGYASSMCALSLHACMSS